MTQTPPPAPPPPPGAPDRRALLQAFQDVVRSEQEKKSQPPTPEPTTRRTTRSILLLTAIGLIYLIVAQPRWLFTQPPEEPPALREASLRVRMFVEIDRVERFFADSGRLPRTLAEAGADTSGLTYTPTDGGYTLRGVNNGFSLTYRSGTPPREFLGDSYRMVTQRGKS